MGGFRNDSEMGNLELITVHRENEEAGGEDIIMRVNLLNLFLERKIEEEIPIQLRKKERDLLDNSYFWYVETSE